MRPSSENQRTSARTKSQQTTTRATDSLLTATPSPSEPNAMVFDLQLAVAGYLKAVGAAPATVHALGSDSTGSNLKVHFY